MNPKSAWSLLAIMLTLSWSCANPSRAGDPAPSAAAATAPARFLIRVEAGVDPQSGSFLARLSEHTGTQVHYVRRMSDQVHVIEAAASGADRDQFLSRLRSYREISSADEDRLVRRK